MHPEISINDAWAMVGKCCHTHGDESVKLALMLVRADVAERLDALKGVMQTAENWACNCEINGEGPNNPAAVAVRDAKRALAKATD